MAITAKPKKTPEQTVDVDALINRGGSVATSDEHPGEQVKPVLLRVPTDILETIDAQIKGKRVRIPRHQWIIEAIIQRMEKDAE